MAFHVGQKVVCVKTLRTPNGETPPALNAIYHIRAIVDHGHDIGVRLCEIINEPRSYGPQGRVECTFHPSCFRPIVERKTDISIFKAMLNPHGVDA